MDKGYLIDSNTAIDYLDNKLPDNTARLIDSVASQVSVITRMELLGWANATEKQMGVLQKFISTSFVFNLYEPIIVKAIYVRKTYRIKLPDAIIASTALVHQLTLVTRNSSDFKNIAGLKLLNPFEK